MLRNTKYHPESDQIRLQLQPVWAQLDDATAARSEPSGRSAVSVRTARGTERATLTLGVLGLRWAARHPARCRNFVRIPREQP
jgi:hypothetical protein